MCHPTSCNQVIDWEQELGNDTVLREMYPQLKQLAHKLVFTFNVSSWRGQEHDLAEDIVQESLLRLLEYIQKGKDRETIAIRSLKPFLMVIASNYSRDLRRHDQRLIHPNSDEQIAVELATEEVNLLDVVTTNAYQELLFARAAQAIAGFPEKQRKSLLIDLANRMVFDTDLTPLQDAFLKVGIQLQDYKQLLPVGTAEKAKHASLLSHAYKRVRLLFKYNSNLGIYH
jgi:DNA-directed RNA polymerase specialized sigma24 family protein